MPVTETPSAESLLVNVPGALAAVEGLLARARVSLRERVAGGGAIDPTRMEVDQHAVHGFAWLATYVEALRQLDGYAHRLTDLVRLGEAEQLIVAIGFGEYLAQILGGIPMSQGEFVRPSDLGLDEAMVVRVRGHEDVARLLAFGNTPENRQRLAARLAAHGTISPFGDPGLDETLEAIRAEMHRFTEADVVPHAHHWHLTNATIPIEIITTMAGLGVFGLTIPERYGGLGLGKEAMCVVSEELSRGYLGVGSLGTRSEIAAELILSGGTDEQRARYLPKIASGEVLPTAVFTEPDTGSDLASLKTRAVRTADGWAVSGSKTWITHPVRADLMTLLARTDPENPGYRGLSIFLAEKPRGTDADPFPVDGMTGTEIEVLGYRGMKEYEIAFEGFRVPHDALLGGIEGDGFKQLMQTFEAARIQTAARAVGVAQAAQETALGYALARKQFGKPIFAFPRVSDKIVMMAVETAIARQLTYFAARRKDSGRRCDLEAGMAKLLAARVAWAAADNAVQVHGGNGFALEYPVSRILCDARILSIFEGAAEIQAQVIARRLLDGAN